MNPIKPNKQFPIRKNIRLQGHDYCQPGGYFVTICTANMMHIFGQIENSTMIPNQFGIIVQDEWFLTASLRDKVELYRDEFVVMPNHIHGIIWILESTENKQNKRNKPSGILPNSLGAIIAQFKTQTTKKINRKRKSPGNPVWQRNYYDHIIRNKKDLAAIKKYILENPYRWEEEKGLLVPDEN